MSKFFKGQQSDSDSESQSVSSQSSEENKEIAQQNKRDIGYFSSDSSESGRKVIKKKDRRHETMKEIIEKIKKKIKNTDYVAIHSEFEELNKELSKYQKFGDGVPQFYIRIFVILQNMTNQVTRQDIKKLNTNNSRCFNKLKHDLKKKSKEEDFEELIKTFVAKLGEGVDPAESVDSQEPKSPRKSVDDNDLFDSSGDEIKVDDDSSSESDEDIRDCLLSNDPLVRRRFWLLKKLDDKKIEQLDKYAQTHKAEIDYLTENGFKDKKQNIKALRKFDKDESQKEKALDFLEEEKKKIYNISGENDKKFVIDYSPEKMAKKMLEIVENRAKQKYVREYYRILKLYKAFYQDKAENKKLEIILVLVSVTIDYGRLMQGSFITRDLWLEILNNLNEILEITSKPENKDLSIESFNKDTIYHPKGYVKSQITNFYVVLDLEIQKCFKNTEYYSFEYAQRLNDMYNMLKFAKKAQDFLMQEQDFLTAKTIAFKRLESLYYIGDDTLTKLRKGAEIEGYNDQDEIYYCLNTQQLIQELAVLQYKYDEDNQIRTSLYMIYHHCIHNRFETAKDLLLMTHIPEKIVASDNNLQALYNRVIVQMGLAAFRNGNIQESHAYLTEICSLSKTKELLAQGLSKLSPEQDNRRRLLPYHMHINIDIIETVHLIVSMLLEIPNYVAEKDENKYVKPISKHFRRMIDNYHRNYFNGYPETSRDQIFAASKQLINGNWKECYDTLMEIQSVWKKMPYCERTKLKLYERVKEQSFKTYLFSFKNVFESLSISKLASQYELSAANIKNITFKLILSKELSASIHTEGEEAYIVFELVQQTRLQELSTNLIDKIQLVVSQNERILDGKVGNYGFKEDEALDLYKSRTGQKQKKKLYKFAGGINSKLKNKKHTRKQY